MSGNNHAIARRRAFTLIEVLVVVAIIALLVAVLMPALTQARQLSQAVVCLAHLEQQGVALKTYSADSKGILPWAGSFRFSLMEGKYYLGYDKSDPTWVDFAQVNIGVLFPKYVGNTTGLYYCPTNLAVDHNGPNGKDNFLHRYRFPLFSNTGGWTNAHDFPGSPFTAYCYAPPTAVAKSPRDNGKQMYPEDSVHYQQNKDKNGKIVNNEHTYWTYLHDSTEYNASFPGPTSRKDRGRHNLHALVSDGYYTGNHEGDHSIYEGYHLKGYNVLYGDYHAKRVNDPFGKIHAAKLNPIRNHDPYNENVSKVYRVWDYFSQNP